MAFYHGNFTESTDIPKMYMLEEHVVPWLKKLHVRFGLMGEQGAEGIHKHFNSLGRTYSSMPERIEMLMVEHLLHAAPDNESPWRLVKKRKKTHEE